MENGSPEGAGDGEPAIDPVASTNGQPAGPPPMKETNPAAEAIQGYPDKAILNVTLAQLKAVPNSNMRKARSPSPRCGLQAAVSR